MVYEKNEGACKKHIHLSNGFQAEQSSGVLQQQFFAFRRSVLFWRVSEHKWMEVAGSAFIDTQCRDRYMAFDQGWIMDQANGATVRDLHSLRLHDLRNLIF